MGNIIDLNEYRLKKAQEAVDEMVDQADAMHDLTSEDVARILNGIRERQEPLGAEFEAVMDANQEKLNED